MYRHVSAQELVKPTTYFIGVDLAQTNDYTALCVLERSGVPTGEWEQDVGKTIERNLRADSIRSYQRPVFENHFAVRHPSAYQSARPTRRRLHG